MKLQRWQRYCSCKHRLVYLFGSAVEITSASEIRREKQQLTGVNTVHKSLQTSPQIAGSIFIFYPHADQDSHKLMSSNSDMNNVKITCEVR